MAPWSILSSNFAPAFFLLKAPQRRALAAVYAFARDVDDAVDGGDSRDQARARLLAWKTFLSTGTPPPGKEKVAFSLNQAICDYQIPHEHLLGLIEGVSRDIDPTEIITGKDLLEYCYGVASTVGLACLPIFGLEEKSHRDFAVFLGHAVQLTNILRDLPTDVAQGRRYLPQEDLESFSVTDKEIKEGRLTPNLRALMEFEMERNTRLYAKAWAHLPFSSRGQAAPALAMGAVYRNLLHQMKKRKGDVFSRRPRLSIWRKGTIFFHFFIGKKTFPLTGLEKPLIIHKNMPKILIAEDDDSTRELLSFIISNAGFEVLAYPDGQQALEAVRQGKPKLVVLDIMMPEMHGFSVCREIKSDPKLSGVKVLMLSAKSFAADRRQAEEVGADAFMSKPVNPEELLITIQSLLSPPAKQGVDDRPRRN